MPKQLKNPPIKEAILSISFDNKLSTEEIDMFKGNSYIQHNFPSQKPLLAVDKTNHAHEGFIFNNSSSDRTIKLKIGLLSFHYTAVYSNWQLVFSEFQNILEVFHQVTNQNTVTPSLRYVNQITLPDISIHTLRQYLTILPTLGDECLTTLNGLFSNISLISQKHSNIRGNITQLIQDSGASNLIIIDIMTKSNQSVTAELNELIREFQKLREYKNYLFELSLTPKALQQYE